MSFLLFLSLIYLGHSKDCYLSCDDVQTTYNKNLCYQNCDYKIILAYTLSGGLFLLFLILLICCCRYNRYRCLWYIKRKLRREYDQLPSEKIQSAELERQKSTIAKSLRESKNSHILCFFLKQSQIQMTIFEDSIKITQVNPSQYHIYFEGKDRFDQFCCSGSILQLQDTVKLWFLKQYKYYENVNKAAMEDLLVYHALLNKAKKMYIGQWQSYDERIGEKLSGKWFLSVNQTHQNDRFR